MARKKELNLKSTQEDWRDRIHYVDFSSDEEDEVAKWYAGNKTAPFDLLVELVDGKWAVKITPPGKGDDWYFTGTYKGDGEPYSEHSFTVKYPDVEDGISVLYFVLTCWVMDGKFDLAVRPKTRTWLKP